MTHIHPIDQLIAQAAQERGPSKQELRRQALQAASLRPGLRGAAQQVLLRLQEFMTDLPVMGKAQLSLTRRRGLEFQAIAREVDQRARSYHSGPHQLDQAYYSLPELEERGWTPGMLQRLGVPDQHGLRDGRTLPLFSRNRISLLEAHPHFGLNILSANRHRVSSDQTLEIARVEATQAIRNGTFTVPAADYAKLRAQALSEAQLWWAREQRRRASNGEQVMALPEGDHDLTDGFTLTLLRMATPLKLALSTPGWEMDPHDVHELTTLTDTAIVKVYPQLSARVAMEHQAREQDLAPPQDSPPRAPGFGG